MRVPGICTHEPTGNLFQETNDNKARHYADRKDSCSHRRGISSGRRCCGWKYGARPAPGDAAALVQTIVDEKDQVMPGELARWIMETRLGLSAHRHPRAVAI